MPDAVAVGLAAAPLVVVAVLLVGLLWPASRAMPLAWAVAVLAGATVWQMPPEWLAAASISGVLTALEILWIVFGALVLLYTLVESGAVERINAGFAAISPDPRVQVVLLAFFLSTFLEGVAGFGTPAAVVAPLLVALRFPPLAAVVSALLGHCVATLFGAVGTPVIVGFRDPLQSVSETIAEGGFSVGEFATAAGGWGALVNAVVGVVMPLLTVAVIVHAFGPEEEPTLPAVRDVAGLCIVAGLAFVVPYWLTAWVIGPELPSIVAAMVGGGLVVLALRAGYFLPETEWSFPDREQWPEHWVGDIEPGGDAGGASVPEAGTQHEEEKEAEEAVRTPSEASDGSKDSGEAGDEKGVAHGSGRAIPSLGRAWAPYLVLVMLLVGTRILDPVAALLQGEQAVLLGQTVGVPPLLEPIVVTSYDGILGTELDGAVRWAYVPGTWLVVTALVATALFGLSAEEIGTAWREAGSRLVEPAVALVFVIPMVQIMLESGTHPGAPEYGSMMTVLADATASTVGPAYPMVAPAVGALGTFITGSITVSNVTFTAFQFEVAQSVGVPTQVIVAGQGAGASIGNAVAIHNVIAALATVGLVGQTGTVIRMVLVPLTYYLLAAGLVTTALAYVVVPGLF